MQGSVLGSRYRVIEYIAKGGFGKTYLAEDTQLPVKDKCVVKQLYPSIDDPNFIKVARRLFKKEAETLNTLGIHNQIPQLLAYFEEDEKFYLVQQYIEGHTLSKELVADEPWLEAKVVNLLQDCLNILDFIHAEGVIHRDVKPDNLIRRQADRKLVLVDFGTVKEVIIEQTQLIPATVAVGTRGYMPTEQARGKPRITSDIYALGIIAIQALTGVHPTKLEEDDNGEIVWQSKAQCSNQLKAIVAKMTRYHFKERYQSARENIAALANLGNTPQAAIPPTEAAQVQYTPTVQLGDAPLPNSPITLSDTALTSSSVDSDRSILGTSINSNSSDRGSELPAASSQQPQLVDTNLLENASNSRPNTQKSRKNKNLATLGTALVVGAIASGGMYLLNRNSTPTAENPAPTAENPAPTVENSVAPVENPAPIVKNSVSPVENPAPIIDNKVKEVDSQPELLLAEATKLYEQEGNLEKAIATVGQIPEDSSVKAQANEAVNAWEADYRANEATIATAEQALIEEKWQDAKEQAVKVIDSSSSTYWQEKADAIVARAETGIARTVPPEITTPPIPEIPENPVPIIEETGEPKITAPPESTTRSKSVPSNPKPQLTDPVEQNSSEPLRDLDGNGESLPDTPANASPENNTPLRDL